MLIVRRVADVQNDKMYPDDSNRVTMESRDIFDSVSEKLIKDYGNPEVVFITPYAVGLESVKSLDQSIVVVDSEIGKLQLEHSTRLRDQTTKLNPVYDSSIDDFKNRIMHRNRRLIQIGNRKVVWVVTHEEVIRQFAVIHKLSDVPRKIPVDYVISAQCTLSRMSTTVSSETPVKPQRSPPKCINCNKVSCICDEISASLSDICMRCGRHPCSCIVIKCKNCGQTNCICKFGISDYHN